MHTKIKSKIRLKLLNLGCGGRYHARWINVDVNPVNNNIMKINLKNGIPFSDNYFSVVYHSHLLEHFPKQEGKMLMQECFRVLKRGGIIRIATPDLEQIVKNYLKYLHAAIEGEKGAEANYEWTMLELYDQTVRAFSGGEMGKYLRQEKIPNEEFVFERIGSEAESARLIKENHFRKKVLSFTQKLSCLTPNLILAKLLLKWDSKKINEFRFRSSGEVHFWMYDRFSLAQLLHASGFRKIAQVDAFTSVIPDWNTYKLDGKDRKTYKPDSLFMEAQKI